MVQRCLILFLVLGWKTELCSKYVAGCTCQLEFFLGNTYLLFQGQFYEQTKGGSYGISWESCR